MLFQGPKKKKNCIREYKKKAEQKVQNLNAPHPKTDLFLTFVHTFKFKGFLVFDFAWFTLVKLNTFIVKLIDSGTLSSFSTTVTFFCLKRYTSVLSLMI